MPLPADDNVVKTGDALVKTLRGAFETPASYRPGAVTTSIVITRKANADPQPTPKAASSAAPSTPPPPRAPSPPHRTSPPPLPPS